MNKPHARLQTWIWVCLYAGLLPLAMTAFLNDPMLATTIRIVCGVLVVIGVLLWVVRTRQKDTTKETS